ncbi:MAG TPA: 4-hydroxy-tetrahydrodipicolinate reductase, partial [Rhodanobacter sp.]
MTSSPIRLAINGASGRMGQALLSLLRADGRFEPAYAVVSPGSPHDGRTAWPGHALRYAHDWSQAPALDVVVDFSGPAGLAATLDHCLAHGVPLVTGTTGLDAALQARLEAAGARIALLRAANFSLGVALLTRVLREAA